MAVMDEGDPGSADQELVILATEDERVNGNVAVDFQRELMAPL